MKNPKVVELFEEKLRESRSPEAGQNRHKQMVFSRNADAKLQEILDLVLRDFVTPWYSFLVPEYHHNFTLLLRDEIWLVMVKVKGES